MWYFLLTQHQKMSRHGISEKIPPHILQAKKTKPAEEMPPGVAANSSSSGLTVQYFHSRSSNGPTVTWNGRPLMNAQGGAGSGMPPPPPAKMFPQWHKGSFSTALTLWHEVRLEQHKADLRSHQLPTLDELKRMTDPREMECVMDRLGTVSRKMRQDLHRSYEHCLNRMYRALVSSASSAINAPVSCHWARGKDGGCKGRFRWRV